MRVAIIDLGTNTFHLLIADASTKDDFKTVFRAKSSVRLGEKGIAKGLIEITAFKRAMRTILRFKAFCNEHQVENIYAFATSAVRDASNSTEFVDKVKAATDIDIHVINGQYEAELIYKGVKKALTIGKEPSLIMDIGGGSVEFVIANDEKLFWKHSFDLGVARLMEQMPPSDPISKTEIAKTEAYLSAELAPLFEEASKHNIETLIGSSGSFDTYADMIAWRFHSPSVLKNKTEYVFVMSEFEAIYKQLLDSTVEERRNTKGIVAMRVEMIVLAAILTNLVIRKLDIFNMRLSTYAMKEGALMKLIEESAE